MKSKSLRPTILFLPIFLSLVACSDRDLEKVAQSLASIDQGVLVATQTAKAANAAGVLSDSATSRVMDAVLFIGPKAKEMNSIVRSINTLDPASRSKLKSYFPTLISVASDIANDPELVGVEDPTTKVVLRSTLTSILTTLTIINGIL